MWPMMILIEHHLCLSPDIDKSHIDDLNIVFSYDLDIIICTKLSY